MPRAGCASEARNPRATQKTTAHDKRPSANASEGGHRWFQPSATSLTGGVHASAGASCARARAGASGGKTGVPPARGRTGVQDPRRMDERRAQQKRIAVHRQHCHAAHSTSATCTELTGQLLYPRCKRTSGRRQGPVARVRGRIFATAR